MSFLTLAFAVTPEQFDQSIIEFRQTLKEMVAADSTNPPGNETRIAEIASKRLKAEGIAFEMIEFAPGRANLVARLSGAERKGLLLIAHTDVVGAEGQSWGSPPHQMTEKEGYLIGRGVGDDLGMAALSIEALILIKKSNQPLKRDLVVALTGDEESGGAGIQYLIQNRPETIESIMAINEGGGIVLDNDGAVKYLSMQVAEKTYQDVELTVKGTTGHSSVPMPDNAIVRLSKALTLLEQNKMDIQLIPIIRRFLKERAKVEPQKVAQMMLALAKSKTISKKLSQSVEDDPILSASLRTTCVVTMISGGTRVNALPAEAKANVNCRMLPNLSGSELVRWMSKVISDPKVEVRLKDDFGSSPASPPDGRVPDAISKIARSLWPGVPVIPVLAKGATDSRYLRLHGIHAYGMNPIALTEKDGRRMHGVDERIPIASLRPGIEFYYRVISELVF